MVLKHNQRFLLLRYSTKQKSSCIKEHDNILNLLGYCWFGKVGQIPSKKMLKKAFEEDTPTLLLYQKDKTYLCVMESYSLMMPESGVPKYYNDAGIIPSIFFKLRSIDACESDLLHSSIVDSTGRFADDALYHSRISFMLCRYEDDTKRQILGKNECRYRVDDYCICRASVNHDSYCGNPSSCTNQRR